MEKRIRISARVLSIAVCFLIFAQQQVDAESTEPKVLLNISPTMDNGRNSEGDILELRDGSLALVYSCFLRGAADETPADIAMQTSPDGGHTWTKVRTLIPHPKTSANVMSVTLRRLPNGEILLFYLRKDTAETSCNLFVRRSSDELKTLSEPTRVTLLDGYHVVNNDRVLQLKSGRLIVPAAFHTDLPDRPVPAHLPHAAVPLAYYSDDMGHTWKKDATEITPVAQREIVFQEPGVVELADGRIWMWIRTNRGYQFGCYSSDQGVHWTAPTTSSLASPTSPASIKVIPGTTDLLCIWNDHSGAAASFKEKRTPLASAISRDGGLTWSRSRTIESDPNDSFAYTSITFLGDRVMLAYSSQGLRNLRVTEIPKSWLD